MNCLCNMFILIYFSLLLGSSFTYATPIPANRLYEHSINQPEFFDIPSGSNSLDEFNPPASAVRDVHSTIDEVQKLLESDPTLPRLTRGEIEDLFEEVTKEEYERSVKEGDLSRAKHMRALMLVLPYNANQTSDNDLQELYNRPPITKVISNEPKEEKKQKIVIPSSKVEIVNANKRYPTTYKPNFRIKPLKTIPDPTTYHPNPTISAIPTLPITNFVTMPTAQTTITTTTTTTTAAPNYPAIDVSYENNKNRFSSHYSAKENGFDTFKPMPTNPKPIDPELEEILESLGFAAQSQSKKRFRLDEPPPEELSKRMLSSTIKQDYVPEPFDFLPSSGPGFMHANDFRKSMTVNIKPRDFGTFKPIPEASGAVPADLESYLKEFGLYPPFESRSDKALKKSGPVISDRIDDDIGLIFEDHREKAAEEAKDHKDSNGSKNTFKPTNPDEEDYKKLQELLKTLRELQQLNATLTEDVLSKLDPRHFNLSQTLLAQGPNPNQESEVFLSKNEIKRQTESPDPIKFSLDLNTDESNVTTTPSTLSANSSDPLQSPNASESGINNIFIVTPEPNFKFPATTATTTTEETPPDNTAELGNSFAGGIGDIENAEPLPPPRKNGFYFLSDWNSFLEVGEDPDKIVVRFDPKVGDPSRFIPVNVP